MASALTGLLVRYETHRLFRRVVI